MAANSIVLSGRVASGFEEAGAFLSAEGYVSQIKEKMGFAPFPGTLNIQVAAAQQADVKKISAACDITLDGFSKEGRKFGPVKAKKADLNGVPVFIGEGARVKRLRSAVPGLY